MAKCHTCHSYCCNFLLAVKDKLASKTAIKNSSIFAPIITQVAYKTQTLALAQTLVLAYIINFIDKLC